MNTTTYKDFTDDVQGVVVGTYFQQAFLTYEGRKQGSTIYARTDEEAKEVANAYIQNQREECGEAFAMIYPNKAAWQVKFV